MNKNVNTRSLGIIGIITLCTAMIAACSDSNNDSDPQALPDNTRPALSDGELAGTWSTGCILDDVNDASDGYEIESVSFSAQRFTASAASFSDAGCTTAIVDDDVNLEGTYILGGAVTTVDGQPATEIDFAYTDAVTGQQRNLLDLVSLQNDSLFLGEGDFDELLEIDPESRPVSLDLLVPYFAQP